MDRIEAKQQLFELLDRSPDLVEAWGRTHARDQAWENDKGVVAAQLVQDRENYRRLFDLVAAAADNQTSAINHISQDPDIIQYLAHMAGAAICECHAKLIEEYREIREMEDDSG